MVALLRVLKLSRGKVCLFLGLLSFRNVLCGVLGGNSNPTAESTEELLSGVGEHKHS